MGGRILQVVIGVFAILVKIEALDDPSCAKPIGSLSACSDFIYTGLDSTVPPTKNCCVTLKNIVHTHPFCLCTIVNPKNFLVKTRAMDLPKACNLTVPSFTLCPVTPPSSGYGVRILDSLLLCFLTVVSFTGIFRIV